MVSHGNNCAYQPGTEKNMLQKQKWKGVWLYTSEKFPAKQINRSDDHVSLVRTTPPTNISFARENGHIQAAHLLITILSTKMFGLYQNKKNMWRCTPQPTQKKSDAQGFSFTADPSFPTSNSSTFADATRSVTVSRTSRKSKHQAHKLVLEDLDESTTFLRKFQQHTAYRSSM